MRRRAEPARRGTSTEHTCVYKGYGLLGAQVKRFILWGSQEHNLNHNYFNFRLWAQPGDLYWRSSTTKSKVRLAKAHA